MCVGKAHFEHLAITSERGKGELLFTRSRGGKQKGLQAARSFPQKSLSLVKESKMPIRSSSSSSSNLSKFDFTNLTIIVDAKIPDCKIYNLEDIAIHYGVDVTSYSYTGERNESNKAAATIIRSLVKCKQYSIIQQECGFF